MVLRRRFRSFFTALALYIGASLLIGYFAVNAYTGNRGLRAQQDLDYDYAELSKQLTKLREERVYWERRVALLRPDSIDPDMADERMRVVLNYVDRRELVLMLPRR